MYVTIIINKTFKMIFGYKYNNYLQYKTTNIPITRLWFNWDWDQ